MSQIKIGEQDYQRFSRYLEQQCGIILGTNKQYLVQSRMGRVLREHAIDTFGQFLDELEIRRHANLRQVTIDAMTTNETLWFRDGHIFEHFKQHLLVALAKQQRSIRIWSAACSTGQEPYSLSMMVSEARLSGLIPTSVRVEIIATDISEQVLATARAGLYSELTLNRGISPERLKEFFVPIQNQWQLKQDVRDRVSFTMANLKDPFAGLGRFDLIFCRNVLIYFSSEFKLQILQRMHRQLLPNGQLILGGSESINYTKDLFERESYGRGNVYRAIH